MTPITLADLREKGYPVLEVKDLGVCFVVPGAEFDPDWDVYLGDLGYRCHETILDGHPVTLIQLKRAVPEGKSVYVPPKAPKIYGNEEEVKKVNENRSAQRGPDWSEAQTSLLLKLWESPEYKVFPKETRGLKLAKLPEFAGRSPNSILQKAYKMQKQKTSKEAKKSPEAPEVESADADEKVVAEIADTIEKYVDNRLEEFFVKLNVDADKLTAQFKQLTQAHDELRLDFEAYAKINGEITEAHREELNTLKASLDKLRKQLVNHKHALSGEAVVALGAS